jgi:hypothetical protein
MSLVTPGVPDDPRLFGSGECLDSAVSGQKKKMNLHIRRQVLVLVTLFLFLTPTSVLPLSTAHASTRRILNVYVRLPSKVRSVDYILTMQQRSKTSRWADISQVAPCYSAVRVECNSRIEDPGPIPAVPGRRTKQGAYYRFVFIDLPSGTYRFTGNGYFNSDGIKVVPFTTKAYRITR